jgi:hypothetical protein
MSDPVGCCGGIVDVPDYGIRAKRGFEPLISDDLFYRVQSMLSDRVPTTTPRQRAHPDFLLRAFVGCEFCGQGLTGSWSKGGRYCSKWRFAKARPEPDFK